MVDNNIVEWVEATEDTREKKRRQAIHIVLCAIASSEMLSAQMLMKGGILLAIRYRSTRHTTDIDFSSNLQPSEFNPEVFKEEFENKIALVAADLDYGMGCNVQSFKKNPDRPDASFPTFQIKVGYAYRSEKNNYKQLLKGRSSSVVKIDYSLNEQTQNTEELQVSRNGVISVYSYADLIAEKYRAILQQKIRSRGRRQDIYDLYYLFKNFPKPKKKDKQDILDSLILKSKLRGLAIDQNSVSDPEIIERSKKEFANLQSEIYDELPVFEDAYGEVRKIYESLPWSKIKNAT